MKKIIGLLLFLTTLINGVSAHEYHVAIMDMEHNKDSSSLEITLKLNTADLDAVMSKLQGKPLGLNTKTEVAGTDSLIEAYILDRLSIEIDSVKTTNLFIGKEYEEEFTYVYIEIKEVRAIKQINISCTVLFDVGMEDHGHSHQSNLVNIKVDGKTKSVYLNAHRPSALIEF